MPIYEYRCPNCGKLFEKLVPIGKMKQPCPNCSKLSKKIVSLGNFVLKGRGWAKDNYDKSGLSADEKIGRIGDG